MSELGLPLVVDPSKTQGMLGLVHHQITLELQQASKTDTILVQTVILFNLIILAVNAAVASGSTGIGLYIALFLVMTIAINYLSLSALRDNRDSRLKLLRGLLDLYRDTGVDKYYDSSVMQNYGDRYSHFQKIIACLAGIAIVVPLLIALSFDG